MNDDAEVLARVQAACKFNTMDLQIRSTVVEGLLSVQCQRQGVQDTPFVQGA